MGRASAVGWRGTCRGVGGTFPAPAFPLGETGKGDSIPRCRRQFDVAPIVCTPLLSYVRFYASSLSDDVTNQYVELSISFPEVSPAPPTACRASIRTLNGPPWPGASWGPI